MDENRISRRGILAAAAAALVGATARTAQADPGNGSWEVGDGPTAIGGDASGTLTISADRDLNIGAGHIRMGAQDGNYEFEHGHDFPETHLNSYYIGTPTRTPISVGGDDGQDVLSFVVRGMEGQRNDLQQWAPGGKVTLAVDGDGRLRLGSVVLATEIVRGKARLLAVLPNGTRQLLAAAD